MRTMTLLLALSLATVSLALVPAAEARNFCVAGVDAWCPGLYCKWNPAAKRWDCIGPDPREPPIVCVREPCPGPYPESLLP